MKKKYLAALIGAAVLVASAQASATLINFENPGSRGLANNDAVTNQYADEGVIFSGAFLEATGNHPAPHGFFNDATGEFDDPFTPPPGVPGMGKFFIRSAGSIESRGGPGTYLTIHYTSPVSEASGQIWDIDGGVLGTEQWDVRALNENGDLVASILSPLGTNAGPHSLNALPWTFNLSGGLFSEIDFVFVGSKMHGVGLAFDNFNTNSVVGVPEPDPAWLFGLGAVALVGVGALRAKRRGATRGAR